MKNFIFFCSLFALVLTGATEGAYFAPQGANFGSLIKNPDVSCIRSKKIQRKENPDPRYWFNSHFFCNRVFRGLFLNSKPQPSLLALKFFKRPINAEFSEKLVYMHYGRFLSLIIFMQVINDKGNLQKVVVIITTYPV